MSDHLNWPTLVLNRNWMPVHVTHSQRAVSLLYRELAQAVDPNTYQAYGWEEWIEREPEDDEPTISGPSVSLAIPQIIVLGRFDRLPKVKVAYSKRNVFRRDAYTCQYCGCQPPRSELTIDHVIPRSRGGASDFHNCVSSCTPCNRKKADREPHQAGMRLARQPRVPGWSPGYHHFTERFPSWSPFLRKPTRG